MSANNLCSFFRSCYDDCVQADAVFSWRPDAGVLEAGRGQSRRKTRASWRPDAGALEARRGQSGRKTRALRRQDACRRGVKLFLGSTVRGWNYHTEIISSISNNGIPKHLGHKYKQ
jgi:hypothetical protein